ncbi:hypothetical protein pipiens_011978 [Culex pipiens pipiens]|uniref:ARID domain-containing protein n=3 Tax=Culex pipiens TaxID=7175 RepID=A0ABD1D478_CULPP
MSPAVGQQSLPMPPRPSSSHSQVPNQQQQQQQQAPNQLGSSNSNLGHGNQSQQQQQPPDHSRVASPNRPPSGGPQGPPPPPQQQQQQQGGMAAQGYQTQPPHPPHMHGGYKMGPSPGGPGAGMPGPQQMSPYPPHNPQSQQYSPHSQGSYSPRPQYPGAYGPSPGGPGGQPGQPPPPGPPPNSVAGGPGGYPGHRMPNHVGGPPPHSQYPPHQPYQQGWGPPQGHVNNHQQQQPGQPGKGMPPSPQQPNQAQSQQGPPPGGPPQSGSPRPLNYLKQHLQHKGGYGGAPSPTPPPPQGYGNGPGMHPPMGPPHHMGPPMGPTSMGPPSGTPPNQPPGHPGPNSHPDGLPPQQQQQQQPQQPPHPESGPPGMLGQQDNGISSSGPGGGGGGLPHPVTSLVTTGPDGAPLDEVSQQSTISNTSVASGEDPQCSTPKSRKGGGDLYNQSHLANTPTTASPGPHNQHEDFEMNSPTSWPRTPASPVSIVTCAATRLLPPTRSGSSTGGGSSQLAVYNSTSSRRSRSHLGVGTSSASSSRPSPKMLPPPTASSSSSTSSVAAAASASAAAAAALVAAYWYSYSSYNANSANANANSNLLPAMPPYSNVDPRQTTLLMTRRPAPPAVASASRHVFNSHVPPAETPFRSTKKSDSLNKLYDMDDKPERRPWLDKLLAFMEERRTPITACPTISKTPLDLYKLYVLVQERGGFLEVTKSKTWKDIAGMLGIGASSSAAYTLRKHYTKNLLPFECKFDRGGIDPGPIIAQVEAGSKKKSAKTASVPSPGSSNSQDSFPAPGSSSASMDGYGAYPGGAGYPPGGPAGAGGAGGPGDYPPNAPAGQTPGGPPTPGQQPPSVVGQQRPPSQQSGTQSPHPGSAPPTTGDNIAVSNPFDDPVGPQRPPYQQGAPYPPASRGPQGAPYQGQPGSYQYGAPDQYGPGGAPGQYPPGQQGQYPPSSRPMYPPYGPPESGEGRSTPPAPGSAPPGAGGDPYRGYGSGPYPPPPQQRPYQQQQQQQQPPPAPGQQGAGPSGQTGPPGAGPPGVAGQGPPAAGGPPGGQPPTAGAQGGYPGTPPQGPGQPDYYRQDQPNQPRRHPDFEKNQQPYPPYQQRPMYPGGWQGQGQYRGQYPPQGPQPQPQWGSHNGPRPSGPPGAPGGPPPGAPNQWPSSADPNAANRYPPGGQPQQQGPGGPQGPQGPYPPHQQGQQQPWNQMPPTSQGSPLRPPPRGGKPFASSMQASGGMPPGGPGMPPTSQPQQPGVGIPPGGIPQGPPTGPAGPAPMPATGPSAKPMQAGPPFPPANAGVAPKRDIVFPPDSIESTAPILYKRKRVAKLDIGQTDPWRIFMALRSGLLVESTWALDVLNILLFDDSSVSFFGLSHLPGLLNLLLDHFQKSLSDMFDTKDRRGRFGRAYGWFGKDLVESDEEEEEEEGEEKKAIEAVEVKKEVEDGVEIKLENGELLDEAKRKERLRGSKRSRGGELDLGCVLEVPTPDERIVVFNATTNYTMSSRKGLPVKIQPADDDVFVLQHRRDWDRTADDRYHRETDVGGDPWTAGHSEPDPHDYIMDAFQAEFVNIPFARMIKTSRRYKARCKNNNNNLSSNNNCKRMQKRGSFVTDSSEDESEGDVPASTTNGIVNGTSAVDSGAEEDCKPAVTVKKEPPSSDADCREIDMELEKSSNLSNGPQQEEGKDGSGEVKMEIEEEGGVAVAAAVAGVEEKKKKVVEEKKFNVAATVRDPARVLKRRKMSDYEDECYTRDEASLYLVTEGHDALARRCVAISNILRNLSFVPGNETEFARSSRFLSILGKLLLLHHEHPVRTKKTRNYDREEDADFSDSCSSLQGESEWWWDFLVQIRENMLVSMSNLAGQLDLSRFDEPISRPILDGLLHWSVCPSAHGQDPFPTLGPNSVLSPQRLALEALCKLCVTDANVDLVIATPPFSRLEKLCSVLTRHLCKNEDQVLREFSVNLLHYLAAADSAMARTVAMQSPCVSYLVAFIEQAEQTALGVANQHGINYLRDNPDSMGTSLDMLRRAAGTLLHLAKHPDNRPLFMQQEQRLLGLVMSHILDQQVALIISRVLFQCSRGTGPLTTMEIETNTPKPKKSTSPNDHHPSESSKSSMHLNSIIASNASSGNAASSMAPPPPAAAPSGNSSGPHSKAASSEPLTQLTTATSSSMPAPAAPVNSAPPAFVPPPPPAPAQPEAAPSPPNPAAAAAPAPAPQQHPITASS